MQLKASKREFVVVKEHDDSVDIRFTDRDYEITVPKKDLESASDYKPESQPAATEPKKPDDNDEQFGFGFYI